MDISSPDRRAGLAALLCATGLAQPGAGAVAAPPAAPAAASAPALAAASAPAPAAGSSGQGQTVKTTIPGADARQPPINLQSGPLDLDYRTHHILIHDVTISQGDVTVTADKAEATGLDFENSNWVLTGKVHVKAESQGELNSGQATLEFSHKLLARAVVTGQPAEFQQTRSSTGILAHGHAGTIDYEVAGGTVRLTGDPLTGDAWLTDGHNEICAPEVVYDIRQKQIQASGGTAAGRVHSNIQSKPRGAKDGRSEAGREPGTDAAGEPASEPGQGCTDPHHGEPKS